MRRRTRDEVPPAPSPEALVGGDGEEVQGCPAQAFFGGAMPLRIRAEWGQAAYKAGRTTYPVRRFDLKGHPEVSLAISDSVAARQLLARHDGKSAAVYKDKPTRGTLNKLLANSLTYASPEDWPRQRQAVKLAVGSTVATAKTFQDHTARCSAELGAELRSIAASDTAGTVVDIREPVYRAACRLLCGITLGPGITATKAADALYTLKRAYAEARVVSLKTGRDAKRLERDSEQRAEELNTIVRSVAARHYPSSGLVPTASEDRQAQQQPISMPLIQRLANAAAPNPHSVASGAQSTTAAAGTREVQQSSQRSPSPPLLSFDEVVSNVHSFLLAGFETTAILVLFTLLHLAHDQSAQTDCAVEAAGAALALQQSVGESDSTESAVGCTSDNHSTNGGLIEAALKETLRLYPPVLSLPRLVSAAGDGVEVSPPQSTETDGCDGCPALSVPVRLRAGQRITVCTAAAARVGWARADYWEPRRFYKPQNTEGESNDSDSEQSDDTENEEQHGEMIAFGVGPRACPAGSLSLLLARELTIAALAAVELRAPPGRPVDGLIPRVEPPRVDSDVARSKPAARPVVAGKQDATPLLAGAVAVATGSGGGATGGQVVAAIAEQRRKVEYYWEADTRPLPVLALTTPADVSVQLRRSR